MRSRVPHARAACIALLCVAAISVASADPITTNANNSTAIIIPSAGAGTPYGSEILVDGLHGDITAVSVTLNGLSHNFPDDVEVLLVAPGGQKIKLMSDAGGGNDLNGVGLAFSAASGALLPDSMAITPGIYHPTDYSPGDVLPAPAPAGPYGTDLNALIGPAEAQNGSWRLYVFDDSARDAGKIVGGWTLSITSEGFVSCAAEGYRGSQLALCRQICEVDQPPQRLNGLINAWMKQFHTAPPCAD